MKYGYARVSSRTQDYEAQVAALKAAGCEKIFSEKASGKSTNGRREFERPMKALLPGDAVVVAKLDRLARSTRDLANILHQLEESRCSFVSLGESWCDTTTSVGRLMMTIIKFGRKAVLDVGQRRRIAARYADGQTMADLAREYECGEATIWRALQ